MGIYQVQSNGYAPPGLQVGDQVVTGGGTYLITVVNGDGSYQSRLINAAQTTRNYTGGYDTPGGSAAPPSGGGSSAGSGNSSPAAPGAGSAASRIEKLVEQTAASAYKPVVKTPENAALSSMSFEEALALAEQVMEPQYTRRYQQAATNAAQRLDQAGLYDTLYGQALAADAERDISNDLNAAIYALALELANASSDEALNLLKLAVDERQFGANYNAEQRETALNYLLKLLQSGNNG